MVEATLEALIGGLEQALAELRSAIDAGGDATLADRARLLETRANELARATAGLGGIPESLRERYQALATQANVLVVSCFWRVMVVANLMRDLGLDSGLYRPEGGVALARAESVSTLA